MKSNGFLHILSIMKAPTADRAVGTSMEMLASEESGMRKYNNYYPFLVFSCHFLYWTC